MRWTLIAVALLGCTKPEGNAKAFQVQATVITILLVLATIGNTVAARRDHPWLRLVWVKGK